MTLLDQFAPKRNGRDRVKIDPQLVPNVALCPVPSPDPAQDLDDAARRHLAGLASVRAENAALKLEAEQLRRANDRLEAEVDVLTKALADARRDGDSTYARLVAVETKFQLVRKIAAEVIAAAHEPPHPQENLASEILQVRPAVEAVAVEEPKA